MVIYFNNEMPIAIVEPVPKYFSKKILKTMEYFREISYPLRLCKTCNFYNEKIHNCKMYNREIERLR